MHGNAGRLGHDVAPAFPETEMAGRGRAADMEPAQHARNPHAGLVEMLDRRRGDGLAKEPVEVGMPGGGAADGRVDGTLRQRQAVHTAKNPANPLQGVSCATER